MEAIMDKSNSTQVAVQVKANLQEEHVFIYTLEN